MAGGLDIKMMGPIIAFIFLLTTTATADVPCPDDCKCFLRDDKHFAECYTGNITNTVSNVHPHTTHLLIRLKSAAYALDQPDFWPSFRHLGELEGLILDHDERFCYSRIRLEHSSFPALPRIQRFMNRLQLSMSSDALSGMVMMEKLTLSNTVVEWEAFPSLMNKSVCKMQRLTTLDLTQFSTETVTSSIQDIFKPEQVFIGCEIPSLKELRIRNNGLVRIFPKFYVPFPGLSVLDMSHNYLTRTNYMKHIGMTGIEELLLFNNLHSIDFSNQMVPMKTSTPWQIGDLTDNPDIPQPTIQCNQTSNEFWYIKIMLSDKSHKAIDQDLKNLCISLERAVGNNLQGTDSSSLGVLANFFNNENFTYPPTQLRYLDLSNNALLGYIGMANFNFPFGVDHLEFLNMQENVFTVFHHDLFSNMSLKTLLLGNNNLGPGVTELNVRDILDLQVLDLAFNNISNFSAALVDGMSSLRELNLTGNNIPGNNIIDFNVNLNTMGNLSLLNLSRNNIEILSSSFRSQVELQRLPFTIDLSGNPLSCRCEDLDFIKWLRSNKASIHNVNILTCQDSSVLVGGVIVIYCKRWRLRYWWYITRRGWQQFTSSADTTDYDYDAFVAYDFKDFSWVKHQLMVEMEQKRHFRFCVPHRDFPGGEVLEEIIVDRIHKSRKTILLLTPDFVKSHWCEFEFSMARSRLFASGNDVIVAVILKPLPSGCVSGSLYQVLKKKLYLEWENDDATGQDLFWRKLSDALTQTNSIRDSE
ncbi:hypothetical protein CAPTEDRAFT_189993 [Capitella teleta]|uniref:TIR domain-containing protein n=1 Tax=Capitella teleta TaxID=283909 RepID=R7V8B7_CAPTE|nr:hypothetical protein CAPTEDRAFT_189993 [Capitella teleta]|eukprot:ELU15098.1 hypothetical protein CAPTEDRAFT_189993 [Capitella teleta]